MPKVSVVLRKAYGGAYIVMSSKMIRTDLCFAWPTAEIAVMGPKGAVSILYARQLAAAAPDARDAERARLEREFQERFNSPFVAASTGYIDDVIYPRETRARLAAGLEFLQRQAGRHRCRRSTATSRCRRDVSGDATCVVEIAAAGMAAAVRRARRRWSA